MPGQRSSSVPVPFVCAGVAVLYIAQALIGIGWGLPSLTYDEYLFGGREPWSGERVAGLVGGAARLDPRVGADVDVTPLLGANRPVVLNGDAPAQAEIHRRYRLFTNQPDEMITMMALSGMNPSELRLDPKLYQYGGLFVYPVGALIGFCGAVGLFPVHADASHYLDHPGDFGKFYLVARAYSAAWGLVGLYAVFAIARRLGGRGAGVLAALLFALLPVVVCMSHEAKPHLAGAVLMLCAVAFAMRWVDRGRRLDWAGMCVCCGAALGTVLSSLPIFVLVPVAGWLRVVRSDRSAWVGGFARETLLGWLAACAVYLLTNPYVAINLFVNRDVLASNFGNSLAMYDVSRVAQGVLRVVSLTVEGATVGVLMLGVAALALGVRRANRAMLPLVVPAAVFALQFVLIGAGKPDEYGRFGIFYEAALVIGCACLLVGLAGRMKLAAWALGALVVGCCLFHSGGYLWSFHADANGFGSRVIAARILADLDGPVAVDAEPAPYSCPPLDFLARDVVLIRDAAQWQALLEASPQDRATPAPRVLVGARDYPSDRFDAFLREMGEPCTVTVCESRLWILPRSRISWANKPVVIVSVEPGE